MNGTPNGDDRMSDVDACVNQLDGGNGFGTGHFGYLMGLQDEDVGQVGTGNLEAREYSSDTDRQVGKRVSKLYMNRSTGLQLSTL